MGIQKINTIKKYKSFCDYSWSSFLNTENLHSKINIFYGENGTGKSSICNILKSVSQGKDFTRYFPEEVELQIGNTQYKYINQTWTNSLSKGSMLFFDKEFVERNVHLGRDRGTQQGEQEQESGKLIIEFDAEAIRLRSLRDNFAKVREDKSTKVDEYQKENSKALDFELPDEQILLFNKYKTKNNSVLDRIKNILEERKVNFKNGIKNDQLLLQKANAIQEIHEIEDNLVDSTISSQSAYQNVFNFDLKEQVKLEVQDELIKKIQEHKDFFEKGLKIRESYPKKCPFCQSGNQETEIKKIIDTYNRLYDDSYRKQKAIFERNKQQLINELGYIQDVVKNFNASTIFISLKRLSDKYSIKNLYSVEEEAQFQKTAQLIKISELKNKLSILGKPSKEDIAALYKETKTEYDAIVKFFKDTKRLILKKNRIINLFKKENTNLKLSARIIKTQDLLQVIKTELDFLESANIEKQKLKLDKLKVLQNFQRALEKAKGDHKSIKEKYEKYCSTEAFEKTLTKIESYFNHFNFSFKLELDTPNRNTGLTKEPPFAFKIIDVDGNERDLREGLSEGEIQVLSICFFFAFLDIQKDKKKKILVFDDPITSLDNSNLNYLVDLIAEKQKNFSQTFIFTHHMTFLKFLRKRIGQQEVGYKEFNIIRNKKEFGGTFINKSHETDFLPVLRTFDQDLKNWSPLDIELKIIEYGQYLRYEIEKFIKNTLLHINDFSRFEKVVEGIKNNQKITPAELDKIKDIYSFCNWTTSHIDVGDDHGLGQLKEKIAEFVKITT